MNKKCIAVLVFLFCINSLWASNGGLSGEKNLKTISTEYFDIIYSPESVVSASILYSNADEIYREVAHSYGKECVYRMPIFIFSNVQQLNANWTSYPYNHIKIYDTAMISDLNVYSENLLSVFKHEVTHAFTFNMKNRFWDGVDKVLGDPVNLSAVWVTGGIAEGATLTSESAKGEGRLNNGYAKQPVIQAAIENKFPAFSDVQGASNSYPSGVFYIFNGMFSEYLQEKYGMEKYAQFWYEIINGKTISLRLTFKKIYGTKLKTEWNDFYLSVLNNKIILEEDFPEYGISDFTDRNKNGNVYSSVCKSDKGLYFLDKRTGKILFLDKENYGNPKAKFKTILTVNYATSISATKDGNFLLINYLTENENVPKSRSFIYSVDQKISIQIEGKGLFDSTFVSKENEQKIISKLYKDQNYQIKIWNLEMQSNGRFDITESKTLNCGLFNNVWDFCDLPQDKFSFFAKSGKNTLLIISDFEGNTKSYKLPDSISVRNASIENEKILFSFAFSDTQPRLGYFDTNTEELFLGTEDFSGGIYYPVGINENEILYLARFYKSDSLFTRNEQAFSFEKAKCEKTNFSFETEEKISEKRFEYISKISETEKNYVLAKNLTKGIFYPFSLNETTSYVEGKASSLLPFGFTYLTSAPWASLYLTLSFGYGYLTNSEALSFKVNGETLTSNFKYMVQSQTEFDDSGWKSSNFSYKLSTEIPFGTKSYFNAGTKGLIQYGKRNEYLSVLPLTNYFCFEAAKSLDQNLYFYDFESVYFAYSYLYMNGPGRKYKSGFTLSSALNYSYNQKNNLEMEIGATIYFPGFSANSVAMDRFTYNLPAKFNLALFPQDATSVCGKEFCLQTSNFYGRNRQMFFTGMEQIVLFAVDVQKAVPGIPIVFFKDFAFSVTAYQLFYEKYDSNVFFHMAYLPNYLFKDIPLNKEYLLGAKAELNFAPNIGQTTNTNLNGILFCEFLYNLKNEYYTKPFVILFGISTKY